jgi:hypothetical protein
MKTIEREQQLATGDDSATSKENFLYDLSCEKW